MLPLFLLSSLSLSLILSISPEQHSPECRKEEDCEHGRPGVRRARVGPRPQALASLAIGATDIRP